MYAMGNIFRMLSERWHHATPTEFAIVALTAIVTVWFINKYYAN